MNIYPTYESFILFKSQDIDKALVDNFKEVEIFTNKGFTILEGNSDLFSKKQIEASVSEQISTAYKLDPNEVFKLYSTQIDRVTLKKEEKGYTALTQILSEFDIIQIEEKYGIYRIHIKILMRFLILQILFMNLELLCFLYQIFILRRN